MVIRRHDAPTVFPEKRPDWCNLNVIHRNLSPPRSHFFPYRNRADALSYDESTANALCLSGLWKFRHVYSPFQAPPGFESPSFDTSEWDAIKVPSMWQLEGYGHPQYLNFDYPFPVDPPNVPFDNNQTGCYVHKFQLPRSFGGQQLRLRFEGVDSAFHVFVNGKEIGYSQGARNPSEFDVTDAIESSGENTLAVRVYQFCDGSYIEDQDQWRMSGIFRDVFVLAFPNLSIQDFQVKTLLDDDYRDAVLSVKVELGVEAEVQLELLDAKHDLIVKDTKSGKRTVEFRHHVAQPHRWTAETPDLYHLVLTVEGYTVAQRIGFRRVEIKNGLLLVNGKRVVFRGVNRHEHHPLHGRAVPYDFMKRDLLLMKEHNINAIRTCHQPSDPRLYDLCDELGIWVMDEADLECHGFGSVPGDAAGRASDNPEWEEAYVDRARQLVMRDKNHACVVIWSLGNEAFYGRNHEAMYDWIKSVDDTRPVHYEGDGEARTVDLFSWMYPDVDGIIEFGKEDDFKKPLVLCEFAHAMGNGPGNIKGYIDAFYQYPRLQGGWVWEWANHGLLKKNRDGEQYYGYGGDFGDVPNDYNFVMDGLLFSNHTPSPGLIEYKKAIEPVQVLDGDMESVTIINRYDFITLDHLRCELTLMGDGQTTVARDVAIPNDIQPGQKAEVRLPKHYLVDLDNFHGETYLSFVFLRRHATLAIAANHVVATGQVGVKNAHSLAPELSSNDKITISRTSPTTLKINTSSSSFTFSTLTGTITSWLKAGNTELIHSGAGPLLDFYRPLTDNDRPQDGQDWLNNRVHELCVHTKSVNWSSTPHHATVIVESRTAPPVLEWSIRSTTTYTFSAAGTVKIHVQGEPRGIRQPYTLARVGLTMSLVPALQHVTWFGRGPSESYRDKKLSQLIGTWVRNVDDLWTDYEFPQESGNRTDVRWVRLDSSSKTEHENDDEHEHGPVRLKASFGTQEGCSFQTSHYRTSDVDAAQHPFELHAMRRREVMVRLDASHHGLGTGSCGPKTAEEFALRCGTFEFEVDLA